MNPTTTAEQARKDVPMDDFITLRADWVAAGRPSVHPYWDLELPAPGPVVPLVAGITPEMVVAAKAMADAGMFPERPLR